MATTQTKLWTKVDLMAFGSEQGWIVFPQQREVHQYLRGEADVRTYSGDDTIEASSLLPDLEI